MTEKKAFVIGGGGFLGFHLAEDLHQNGYKVTLFDLRKTLDDDRFDFVVGDLSDAVTLARHMRGHDVVFHVASPPYFLNDRSLFYRVNVEGTFGVIEACKSAGIRKLVLTSSCSVVYNGNDIQNGTEDLEFPANYLDYYTETKMMQERIVLSANGPNFYTVAIRPHGIFGPHDHTVSEIAKKAHEGKMKFIIGNGSNIVDFTYVRNVTHGHVLAAERLGSGSVVNGQAYNITNDEPVHFWVFTGKVLVKLGFPEPFIHLPLTLVLFIAYLLQFMYICLRPYMPMPFLTPFKVCLAGTHHYYSCEKAKRDLNYRPKVSLEEGLDLTVKSFKNKLN